MEVKVNDGVPTLNEALGISTKRHYEIVGILIEENMKTDKYSIMIREVLARITIPEEIVYAMIQVGKQM